MRALTISDRRAPPALSARQLSRGPTLSGHEGVSSSPATLTANKTPPSSTYADRSIMTSRSSSSLTTRTASQIQTQSTSAQSSPSISICASGRQTYDESQLNDLSASIAEAAEFVMALYDTNPDLLDTSNTPPRSASTFFEQPPTTSAAEQPSLASLPSLSEITYASTVLSPLLPPTAPETAPYLVLALRNHLSSGILSYIGEYQVNGTMMPISPSSSLPQPDAILPAAHVSEWKFVESPGNPPQTDVMLLFAITAAALGADGTPSLSKRIRLVLILRIHTGAGISECAVGTAARRDDQYIISPSTSNRFAQIYAVMRTNPMGQNISARSYKLDERRNVNVISEWKKEEGRLHVCIEYAK
jgi:hypothetical protein